MFHQWAFSWPANRRVMYNRASADKDGNPWDPTRVGIKWNGEKWVGDVPDMKPDAPAGRRSARSSCSPRESAASSRPVLNDGPFPEHYEAVEAPSTTFSTRRSRRARSSTKFKSDLDVYGTRDRVPDRLHDVPADRALPLLDPAPRRSEHAPARTASSRSPRSSRRRRGSRTAAKVKVSSARGSIEGVAMVTKRLKPMKVDGKPLWQIGFPLHWGFAGEPGRTRGRSRTSLTPSADRPEHVDARVQDLPREAREGVRGGGHERSDTSRSAAPPPRSGAGSSGHPHASRPSRSTSTRRPASAARPARSPARNGTTWRSWRRDQVGTYQTLPTLDAGLLEPDPLRRARGRRRPQVAHAQGPVHALRRAGLPRGLSRRPARSSSTRTASWT